MNRYRFNDRHIQHIQHIQQQSVNSIEPCWSVSYTSQLHTKKKKNPGNSKGQAQFRAADDDDDPLWILKIPVKKKLKKKRRFCRRVVAGCALGGTVNSTEQLSPVDAVKSRIVRVDVRSSRAARLSNWNLIEFISIAHDF